MNNKYIIYNKKRNSRFNKFVKYIFVLISCITLIWVLLNPYTYMEIDSYVLPIISLEYRGSIIMDQQDIDTARRDLPQLYENVYSFDDLRASKLCTIDDNHWISYYFPVYALICLPVKLLLQILGLNQCYSFTLTNGLVYILALYVLYNYLQKKKMHHYILLPFLVICPNWIYLNYIGAEPVMFSALVMTMLFWDEKKYRISALIISIMSMMNPTIMGFGIILFLDFVLDIILKDKRLLFTRDGIKKTLHLCSCYLPSLFPFAVNWFYLGTINPTIINAKVESVWRRVLAYFFDINFGLASISVIVIILYILTIIYAIVKKDRKLFMTSFSVIFTTVLVSFQIHINCGMLNVARYVLWLYPVFIFSIYKFLQKIFTKVVIVSSVISFITLLSIILTYMYNGRYAYTELNHVAKTILNYFPQYYVSFCDSTFNSRINHVDGGYNLNSFVIYCDSITNDVRKIMYCNIKENKEILENILESDKDNNSEKLHRKMRSDEDNKIYYINIDRYEIIQYKISAFYSREAYDWVKSMYVKRNIETPSPKRIIQIVKGIFLDQNFAYKTIYDLVVTDNMSDDEFIHCLYNEILGRDEAEEEHLNWINEIEKNRLQRFNVLETFLGSDEFHNKVNYTFKS